MEYNCLSLNQIADSITEKISIDDISTLNYISTENMIVNKAGVEEASKLPNTKKVNFYRKKDILVSNIRPYFKKIWQADNDGGASADVLIYRANQNYIDEEYLYYFLSQDSFFDFMVQTSKGTKMPRGDKNAIENYEVRFPKNIVYQRKVASIGRTIDEKIKLNKEIITNLEELIQAIFKNYGFEERNISNPVKLEEISECQNGYAFYKTGYSNDGYRVVDLANVDINGQFVTKENDKFISFDKVDEKKEKFILKKNDLVMIMTDRTQDMNILGKVGRIPESNHYILNQRIFRIRVNDRNLLNYVHTYLNSDFIRNQLKNVSLGSAQKYINTGHIKKLPILLPTQELIDKFNESTEALYSQKYVLIKESIHLKKLRNTLLPKLMSGELELPDNLEVDKDELLQ